MHDTADSVVELEWGMHRRILGFAHGLAPSGPSSNPVRRGRRLRRPNRLLVTFSAVLAVTGVISVPQRFVTRADASPRTAAHSAGTTPTLTPMQWHATAFAKYTNDANNAAFDPAKLYGLWGDPGTKLAVDPTSPAANDYVFDESQGSGASPPDGTKLELSQDGTSNWHLTEKFPTTPNLADRAISVASAAYCYGDEDNSGPPTRWHAPLSVSDLFVCLHDSDANETFAVPEVIDAVAGLHASAVFATALKNVAPPPSGWDTSLAGTVNGTPVLTESAIYQVNDGPAPLVTRPTPSQQQYPDYTANLVMKAVVSTRNPVYTGATEYDIQDSNGTTVAQLSLVPTALGTAAFLKKTGASGLPARILSRGFGYGCFTDVTWGTRCPPQAERVVLAVDGSVYSLTDMADGASSGDPAGTTLAGVLDATTAIAIGPQDVTSISISAPTSVQAGAAVTATVTAHSPSMGDLDISTSAGVTLKYASVSAPCSGPVCTPTRAGKYTLTATWRTLTAGQAVIVTPGSAASIAIGPLRQTVPVGGIARYTTALLDKYRNVISRPAMALTMAPEGTCVQSQCTPNTAGTHYVSAKYQDPATQKTFATSTSSNATVEVNQPSQIDLNPVPVRAYLPEHGSQGFTVTVPGANGAAPVDVTSSAVLTIAPQGSCTVTTTAAKCVVGTAGTYTVTATVGSLTATYTIEVRKVPTRLTITGSKTSAATGEQVAFTARGYASTTDRTGWDVTGETTFSGTGLTCVGASCSASTKGTYTVKGAWLGGSPSATTSLSVTGAPPGTADHLRLNVTTPGPYVRGQQVRATVGTYDATDVLLKDVTTDPGTVLNFDGFTCAANKCTATTAGHYELTATYGGLTSDPVVADIADHITLNPASATIDAGAVQVYTVDLWDSTSVAMRQGVSPVALGMWWNPVTPAMSPGCIDNHCQGQSGNYSVTITNGTTSAGDTLTINAAAVVSSCTPNDHLDKTGTSDYQGDGWLEGTSPLVAIPCGESAHHDELSPSTLYFWNDASTVATDVTVEPDVANCTTSPQASCVFADGLQIVSTSGVAQVKAPGASTASNITNASYCHDPNGWRLCFSDRNHHIYAVIPTAVSGADIVPVSKAVPIGPLGASNNPPPAFADAPAAPANWWQLQKGRLYHWNNAGDVQDHLRIATTSNCFMPFSQYDCSFDDGKGDGGALTGASGNPGASLTVWSGGVSHATGVSATVYCQDPALGWLLCLVPADPAADVWALPLTITGLSQSAAAVLGGGDLSADPPALLGSVDMTRLPHPYLDPHAVYSLVNEHLGSATQLAPGKAPVKAGAISAYALFADGATQGELDIMGANNAWFVAPGGAQWHIATVSLGYLHDSNGKLVAGPAEMVFEVHDRLYALAAGLTPSGPKIDPAGTDAHDYLYDPYLDSLQPADGGNGNAKQVPPVVYDSLPPDARGTDTYEEATQFALPSGLLRPRLEDPNTFIDDGDALGDNMQSAYDLSLTKDTTLLLSGNCSDITKASDVAHAAFGFVPNLPPGKTPPGTNHPQTYRQVLILRMAAGKPFRVCDLNDTVNDAVYVLLKPMMDNEFDLTRPDRFLYTTNAVSFEGEAKTVAELPADYRFTADDSLHATSDSSFICGDVPSGSTAVTYGDKPVAHVSYGYYKHLPVDLAADSDGKTYVGLNDAKGTDTTFGPGDEPVIAIQFCDMSVRLLAVSTLASVSPSVRSLVSKWMSWMTPISTALSQQQQTGTQDTVSMYLAASVPTTGDKLAPQRADFAQAVRAESALVQGASVPAPSGLGRNYLTPADAAAFFDANAIHSQLASRAADPMIVADVRGSAVTSVEAAYEQKLSADQAMQLGVKTGDRTHFSGGLWSLTATPQPVLLGTPLSGWSTKVANWIVTAAKLQDQKPEVKSAPGMNLDAIAASLRGDGISDYNQIREIVDGAFTLLGISTAQIQAELKAGNAPYTLAAYRLRLALDPQFDGKKPRAKPTWHEVMNVYADALGLHCLATASGDPGYNQYLDDEGLADLYRTGVHEEEACNTTSTKPVNLIGDLSTQWQGAGLTVPTQDTDKTWLSTVDAARVVLTGYSAARSTWATTAYQLVAAQRGFAAFEIWAGKAPVSLRDALRGMSSDADELQKQFIAYVAASDADAAQRLVAIVGNIAVMEKYAALTLADILADGDANTVLHPLWQSALYIATANLKASTRATAVANNLLWSYLNGDFKASPLVAGAWAPKPGFDLLDITKAGAAATNEWQSRGIIGMLNKTGFLNVVVASLGFLMVGYSATHFDLSDPHDILVMSAQLTTAFSYPTWWMRFRTTLTTGVSKWNRVGMAGALSAKDVRTGITRPGIIAGLRYLNRDSEQRSIRAGQFLWTQMELTRRSTGTAMTEAEVKDFLVKHTGLKESVNLSIDFDGTLRPWVTTGFNEYGLRDIAAAVAQWDPGTSWEDRIRIGVAPFGHAPDFVTDADLKLKIKDYFLVLMNAPASDVKRAEMAARYAAVVMGMMENLSPDLANGNPLTWQQVRSLMVRAINGEGVANGATIASIVPDAEKDRIALVNFRNWSYITQKLSGVPNNSWTIWRLVWGEMGITAYTLMDFASGVQTIAAAIIDWVEGDLGHWGNVYNSISFVGGLATLLGAISEFLGFAILASAGFFLSAILGGLAILIAYTTKHASDDNPELREWAEPFRRAGLLRPNQVVSNADGYSYPSLEQWYGQSETDGSKQTAWPVADADGRAVSAAIRPADPTHRMMIATADGQRCLTLGIKVSTDLLGHTLTSGSGAPAVRSCMPSGADAKEQLFTDNMDNADGTHQFVLDIAPGGILGNLSWACPAYDANALTMSTVSCRGNDPNTHWTVAEADANSGQVHVESADGTLCLSSDGGDTARIEPCNSANPTQLWQLKHVDGMQLNQVASGRCADLPDASTKDDADLRDCGRGAATTLTQFLYPTVLGADGGAVTAANTVESKAVTMLQLSNGVCLSAAPTSGSVTVGTPVRGASCPDAFHAGTDRHGWFIDPIGNGAVLIRYAAIKNSDGTPTYCLDTAGGTQNDGAQLVVGTCDGSSTTQQWRVASSQITGTFALPADTTKCLTMADKAAPTTAPCYASGFSSASTTYDGVQSLETVAADGTHRCLTATPVTAANSSAPPSSEVCDRNTTQQWRVVPSTVLGASVYQIQSVLGIPVDGQRGALTTMCLERDGSASQLTVRACSGMVDMYWTRK